MATNKVLDTLKSVGEAALNGAVEAGKKQAVTSVVTAPDGTSSEVTTTPAATPGYKTSEFYVSIFGTIIAGVFLKFGIPVEDTLAVVSPLLLFITSRGIAKIGK